MSITLRLSLSFAALCTAALAATGFYLYDTLDRHFAERGTAELAGKVRLVRRVLSSIDSHDGVATQQHRFRELLLGHPVLHLVLFDRSGTELLATTPLRPPAARLRTAAPASVTPSEAWIWQASPERRFRTVAAWADLAPGAGEQVLIVLALDTAEEEAALLAHRHHVALALVVGIGAAGLLGFVIARRGLRPLRDVVGAAYRISADRLNERLDGERVPSEMRPLAAGFNAMLARLEESFERLASFSSDLAHELRTPIQNLMGQTQVALTRAREPAEYREVLESNLEEYQRLARMIEDMLFLARADHAQTAIRRETTDLRSALDKVAEFYDALAQEHGVAIERAGGGVVSADRAMTERAIGNLLSNAVRHTVKGGRIEARISPGIDGSMRLSVANAGPGIPPEHRSRVFDRFYRIDGARNGERGGHGLGLAIVRSIMRLHGGTVTLESVPGEETVFTLHFPGEGSLQRRRAQELST